MRNKIETEGDPQEKAAVGICCKCGNLSSTLSIFETMPDLALCAVCKREAEWNLVEAIFGKRGKPGQTEQS